MKRLGYFGPSLVVLVTLALVLTIGPGAARQIAYAQSRATIQTIRDGLDNNAAVAELSNSFKLVAQVVEPSVVHIQVYTRAARQDLQQRLPWFFGPRGPMPLDPEDERMNPDEEPDPDQGMDRYNVPRERGNGSGWVYDEAGHVVTNNHVIDKADKIVVRFFDGTEKEAKVVGRDPKTDVAVLKVEGDTFHPAKVLVDAVEQGEIVFSFGSPFGNEFSMSQGIVSATGRQLGLLGERQGYENFIQTDAAINPGNSGGPLTNLRGEVIGMNTAIATRTGSFAGIGFAIPADMIERVVPQLIESGKVTRGYLGIFIKDLDTKMGKSLGYEGKGVLVIEPIAGGPAAKGGLQETDIITKLQGKAVTTAEQLRESVAAMTPGTEVELEVIRKGEPTQLTITLEELPEQVAAAGDDMEAPSEGSMDQGQQVLARVGLRSVSALTPAMAEQMGIDHVPAVLVRSVREGSVAWEAGIRQGMLITDVMGEPVSSSRELAAAIEKAPAEQGVRLRLLYRGRVQFVVLDVPKE